MKTWIFEFVKDKVPFPAKWHGYPGRYFNVVGEITEVVVKKILRKLVDEAMEGMDLKPFFVDEETRIAEFNKRWKSEGP